MAPVRLTILFRKYAEGEIPRGRVENGLFGFADAEFYSSK
jgi:hypothetical protein